MSTGYSRHKSQIESSRKSNGEFGSYEAAESATSLAPTGDEVEESLIREASERQNVRFAQVVNTKREDFTRHKEVDQALVAHDLADVMRSYGVSEVTVSARGLRDSGYYISSGKDSQGRYLDELDLEDLEREEMEEGLYSAFSEYEITDTYGRPGDTEVTIGASDPHPQYRTRYAAESERDRLLDESRPKGPREQLAASIGDTNNPGYIAAVEALDAADGIDESPNAAVDEVDRNFPDDLRKRELARSVSALLEDEKGMGYDDGSLGRSHDYAVKQVAEGRTNIDSIADEAVTVYKVNEDLETEYSADVFAWEEAMDHAEARVAAGEDADQAYWNTVDHIDDLRADGKLDPQGLWD